ncbi:hypothetical protein [Leucobacter massiliensis]|uniref:Uncharacterized protein n=1 Tax=Leucobacter massiliensis TaxID=1686285 RepID=A0A2S9QRC4_9MICO|nr:hypothetical protein [Leucobacter massiliensis]PRI12144.1 hypothetical protein B4915_03560 [Leucobacter massiliensis]
MGFTFILPSSRRLLTSGIRDRRSEGTAAARADAFRRDYERWSRWGLGLAAFLVTIPAGFVATGLAGAIEAAGSSDPIDIVVVGAAALLCIAGGATLFALWRSGRLLARAACEELRAIYSEGWRSPSPWGWAQVRLLNGEPRIFVRLVTGTLALMLAVGGFAVAARDLAAGETMFTLPSLLVALCSACSGLGQLGGVMRIVRGMSAGDPIAARHLRR